MEADLLSAVRAEQLRLVFAHMAFATPIGLGFAFVMAAYVHREVMPIALWTWLAAKVAIAVPRMLQARSFRSGGEPYSVALERSALLLLAVDGASWGIAGIWWASARADIVSVVIAALTSIACVAAFGLQVRVIGTALFVVPVLLGPSLALLWRDDAVGWFAGTGLLVLLALLLISARSAERRLAEVFRLRHVMARLSEQRGDALRLTQLKLERIEEERILQEKKAHVAAMQEVLQARSAFLAKVSHELRSPLQAIVSAIDVFEMRHGHRIRQDDELIARIRRAASLLNTHLRDLLTLARGQSGRLELRPEPFDACALVEGVVAAVREAALAKQLALSFRVPDMPVFVIADGARLDQVLTNLLTNSVHHTSRGHINIELSTPEACDRHLHITVVDTGEGIPEAVIPHLFSSDKPLTSASHSHGSGMGLAIVGTLLELMGGQVTVKSVVGEGTRFDISVPIEPVDPQLDRPRAVRRHGDLSI